MPSALCCFLTRSVSARRSGCPLGSHAWMLIAMFHLAMDLASCEPAGTRLSPRSAQRHRLPRGVLWSTGGSEEPRRPSPPWPCAPRARRPPPIPLPRARRQLRGRGFAPRDGRPTALPEVIVWGPTGEEDSLESSTLPSIFTTAAATTITTTTAATTAATTVATAPTPSSPAPTPGIEEPRGRPSTAEPAAGHSSGGKDARPPRGLGDTAGTNQAPSAALSHLQDGTQGLVPWFWGCSSLVWWLGGLSFGRDGLSIGWSSWSISWGGLSIGWSGWSIGWGGLSIDWSGWSIGGIGLSISWGALSIGWSGLSCSCHGLSCGCRGWGVLFPAVPAAPCVPGPLSTSPLRCYAQFWLHPETAQGGSSDARG